jgi:SAM-dependent methyltransferase
MRWNTTDDELLRHAEGRVWLLDERLKSLINVQMCRLPSKEVSEQDTRYPIDAAGMRAFLETFFARHFFQVQRTLSEYVDSPDFRLARESGHLRILDIGCGPAVASLAVYDIMNGIVLGQDSIGSVLRSQIPRVTHVLNDTSRICLGVGKHMIAQYLLPGMRRLGNPSEDPILTLASPFPDNLHQIRSWATTLGNFDIVFLSYVVGVLADHYGLEKVVHAVSQLEELRQPYGRMVIIQDRFQFSLMERIARRLGVQCNERTVTHEVYPRRGDDQKYTYTYYDCLYPPSRVAAAKRHGSIQCSPWKAVALE